VSTLALFTSVVLPCFVGCALLLALGASVRPDPLGFVGLVFPAGALVVGLSMFAWLHVGWSLVDGGPQVAVLLLGVLLLLAWRARVRRRSPIASAEAAPAEARRARGRAARIGVESVFACVLALALGDVLFDALDLWLVPIGLGDSTTIWTMRAKMLFQHGAIDADLPSTLNHFGGAGHLDYPLLNPLLQVWMMSSAGELLDSYLRIPTHLWHASLLLCVFAATRRRIGALAGAALAWLYVSLPSLDTISNGTMMDLPVALAFMGLVDRVLLACDEREDGQPHSRRCGRASWCGPRTRARCCSRRPSRAR